MKVILLCLCLSLSVSKPLNKKPSFQFKFPGGEKNSHAKLVGTIDHELTEFTVCHWSKTDRTVPAPVWEIIFNYVLPEKVNYITTAFKHNQLLHAHADENKIARAELSVPSTEWLHLCFVWSVTESLEEVYINGKLITHQTNHLTSLPIKPNGIVQLGRNDHNGRFTGQISELNMWDYARTPDDVVQIYNCEDQLEGNVISWYDSMWELFEGTTVSHVHLPCGGRH